jgi:hypothetical protein
VNNPVARVAIILVSIFMSARNKAVTQIVKKRGRGRPTKPDAATTVVSVALSDDLIAELDAHMKREGIKTRSTAIRQFVREALQPAKREKGNR